MNIGILSFKGISKKPSAEEKRLKEEAIKRGHKARILRACHCVMYCNHKLKLLYKGKEDLRKIDLLIPRVSLTQNVAAHAAMIEQAELLGIPVLNRYYPIVKAKNKLHSLQILNHYGIPVVKTVVIPSEAYLENALDHVETPVILKTGHGSYGKGVMLAETKRAAISTYNIIGNTSEIILLQEYISESKGKDIRAFVVGERVVAGMERAARRGEFRSNIELGGQGSPIELTDEMKNLAIRATKALELDVAGVDIILTNSGPAIMEVNANAGFKMIEEVTGKNVAEAIIKHGEKFAGHYIEHIGFN
jgi:ribosomal protein S6--L-glutamate ligase